MSTTSYSWDSIGTAKRSKRLWGPLITVVTLGICLVLVEVGLELFAPVPDPYEKFKYDAAPLNQYIKSEFPVNFYFNTEPEEGLHGIHGHNVFSTNNMGFRGDYLTIPKPKNEFRIFIVGGSTTECFYLDDSKALNRILQEYLSNHAPSGMTVKVYGAGKSGDASYDHISMIIHRIVHLEPDLIVLFSGINDLTSGIYGNDYLHYVQETPRSRVPLKKFVATDFQIPRRIYYLLKRASLPADTEVLVKMPAKTDYNDKISIRKSVPVSNEKPRTNLAAYANNLRTIIGVAQAHKIQLVFMTQQTTWNSSVDPEARNWHWMLHRKGITYREGLMDEALESLNSQMRQLATEFSVPLYDPAKSIPKSLEFFYDDVHFNEKGASTAGVGLGSVILEKKLIKSSQ